MLSRNLTKGLTLLLAIATVSLAPPAINSAYAGIAVAPGVPIRVTTSSATATTLNLSWSTPAIDGGAAISDYTIQYRKVGELSWSRFDHAASTTPFATVSGLESATSYEFRVAAMNSAGTGPWSVTGPTLAAGRDHGCAIRNDQAVLCWGVGVDGQLGDASTTNSASPVEVTALDGSTPALTAVSLAAGGFHSCALMANGAVTCWGSNSVGQLGNGTTLSSSSPVYVSGLDGASPSTTAVSVSAGLFHSCAVMADGSAKCWGDNGWLQLGDGTTKETSKVPVVVSGFDGSTPAKSVVEISATSQSDTCARLADGSAACWGWNAYGQLGDGSNLDSSIPVAVSGIDGSSPTKRAVSIAIGTGHSCAVLADGKAKCWGSNYNADLGDGTGTSSSIPVSVLGVDGSTPSSTAVAVVASESSLSCALMATGSQLCWGLSTYDQRGGTSEIWGEPVHVTGLDGATPAGTVLQIATGRFFACSALANDAVACWGRNDKGQLGHGSQVATASPVNVVDTTGPGSTLNIFQGARGRTLPPPARPSAPLHVVTSNATSASLDVSWTVPVTNGGAPITDFVVQYRKFGEETWSTYAHAASTQTSISVSGLNPQSSYAFQIAAVNSAGTGPWSGTESTIDSGNKHSCAVMENGTAKCWGDNTLGQLGDGSTAHSRVPVQVSGITGLTPAATAVSVSIGDSLSCALMADGTAKCWGSNNYGQLGDGSTENSPIPVSVSGITGLTPATTAVSVSTGSSHSCAVMADGTAQCWGWNISGQLGNNSTNDSWVPVQVVGITGLTPATTAVSVSAGGYHSCAVMADGSAQCWGGNADGTLGNDSTTNSPVPVPVAGITGSTPATTAISVSTAGHSCAVMANGSAQCWGWNHFGQLGSDSGEVSTVPVQVTGITGSTPATTAVSVSSGAVHSCAVMANGTAQCWGGNSQLGSATNASNVPVAVLGITGLTPDLTVVTLSSGTDHSCALMLDGTAQCWGWNEFGQLGNNTNDMSLSQLPVSGITGLSNATRVAIGSIGRTLAAPPGAPGRPVIISRTTSSARISWTAAAAHGSAITNYVVEYRRESGAWRTFTRPTASTALSVTVTGLVKGDSYTFRVSAVSAGGTGAPSVVSTPALAASAPGAPESVTGRATKVAGQIAVTWTAAALNGAPRANYKVSWLVGRNWTTPVTATGLAYTITKLKPGTYSVKVTATTVEGSASTTKAGLVLAK